MYTSSIMSRRAFRALLLTACLGSASPAFAAALEGDAYKAAEAAYAAINKGDLAGAEKQARAALALQPDSADAVRLVMDILGRQGKAAEALNIANAALAKGTVDADLRAARGYLLAAAGQNDAAVADFTAALKEPGLTANRRAVSLALADAAAKDSEFVLKTLAPFAGETSYDVQARIGFAAFALNRFEQASNAFAVAAVSAPAPEQKTAAFKGQAQAEAALGHGEAAGSIVRTLLGASSACDMDIAYLLMRLGDDATALATFEGRCKDQMTAASHLDAADAARRLNRPEQAAAHTKAALESKDLPPERQRELRLSMADAVSNDNAAVLEALAPVANDPSYGVQARIGFAAFGLERFEQASKAFAMAAAHAATPEEWATALKGQAQADAGLGRKDSVRVLVKSLTDKNPACDMDLAYVLLRVGEDDLALGLFEGRCKDTMTAAAHLDAAYAARRLNRNEIASTHFKAALDADRAAPTPSFDTATAFGIQRGIDSLDRQFGVSAGAFYRGDRTAAGGGSVGQGIVEAYWQPPVIGNRDGKLLQIYGRAGLNALTPASTVQTDSTQGAVGVRYKPFSDLNLLVAGERLFPIGDSAIKDWLVRAGYSIGLNTDIQPTQSSYWTGQIYGEADYFVNQDRFIGTVEGRYGLDSRIGNSPNLLASLFASAAYSYDAAERSKSATAAGVGAGLRLWFRQTEYRAPSSFIQFDIMYRWKLGPTDRAAGLVLQSSLSF